jgi:hypothetical protein
LRQICIKLERRMTRKCPVRCGKGCTETDSREGDKALCFHFIP